jgi:hypothetical protein
VEAAVQEAISVLGPQGFILSPVDNVDAVGPEPERTWNNVKTMIEAWKSEIDSLTVI